MRRNCARLFIHIVFSTWQRLPLLRPDIEARLYASIAAKCRELKCTPLAIGSVTDHIHILVRLHSTIPIARLVKEIKGSSSRLVSHAITPDRFFKWQGSYGAFTVSEHHLQIVTNYVLRQKQHHAQDTIDHTWEETTDDDDGEHLNDGD